MIRVTVELFPKGLVKRGEVLSQMFIANDGTGSHEEGNYKVTLAGEDAYLVAYHRADGLWPLVKKAISVFYP